MIVDLLDLSLQGWVLVEIGQTNGLTYHSGTGHKIIGDGLTCRTEMVHHIQIMRDHTWICA